MCAGGGWYVMDAGKCWGYVMVDGKVRAVSHCCFRGALMGSGGVARQLALLR